jgi:hypothetical protein
MKGNLWQVVVIALALALALPLFVNGGFGAAATQSEANETTTVNFNSPYQVENADAYELNQSITVTQNGTELSSGTDYAWNQSTGEVSWLKNGTASEDSTTIEYQYRDHTDRTTLIATLLEANASWIGLLLLVVAMGFLKIFSIGGGGF